MHDAVREASPEAANETTTTLKGGSLSGTYLISRGGQRLVRKEISLEGDRERGFGKWHSQLKKIQRLGHLFPGLFPKILDFGINGPRAYFEMEYIEGSMSGFDFLRANPPKAEVDVFLNELIRAMDRLHSQRRPSSANALQLYIHEKIERPISICSQDAMFRKFLKHREIIFNGKKVPSLAQNVRATYEIARKYHNNAWECYTHGNLTLENLVWVPDERRIVFIDLLEENISDNIYNEYSQILQSSDGLYEVYNSLSPKVSGNIVTLKAKAHPAITYFNRKFLDFMDNRLTEDDIKVVRLYEVSQFTRMLPYKLRIDKSKMIFFYSLASSIFSDLLKEFAKDAPA